MPIFRETASRVAAAVCLLYGAAASALCLYRVSQFRLFLGDTLIIAQAMVSTLSGRWMQQTWHSSFYGTDAPVVSMANHFAPVYFLLAPVFWIIPVGPGLLALKCLLIAAAGFVLFLIARTAADKTVSFVVMGLFLLSPNSLCAVHDSFHGDYFGPLFFFLAFFFFKQGKRPLSFLFLTLFMMSKESFFLSVIGFGVFVFVSSKEDRKLGAGIAASGLAYGLAAYGALSWLQQGLTPEHSTSWKERVVEGLFSGQLVRGLTDPAYVAYFLKDLKCLSLLSPLSLTWLTQIPVYAILALPLGDHYGTLTTALIFLSFAFVIEGLAKRFPHKAFKPVLLTLLILASLPSLRESASIFSPKNFEPSPFLADQKAIVAMIPPEASVTTSELYAIHLLPRTHVDWVGHPRDRRQYDYVILDLNRENTTGADEWEQIKGYWEPFLKESGLYERVASRSNIHLYRRTAR